MSFFGQHALHFDNNSLKSGIRGFSTATSIDLYLTTTAQPLGLTLCKNLIICASKEEWGKNAWLAALALFSNCLFTLFNDLSWEFTQCAVWAFPPSFVSRIFEPL